MPPTGIKIGTRGSPLALAQARETQQRLMTAHGLDVDQLPIVEIKTSGDIIQDRPLSEVGGKGLFTKEIEHALFAGDIDVAVHSMKDLETRLPDGLEIAAVLEREDVRDAFISRKYASIDALPEGATVGTSSLRRRAQLRHVRPDVNVVEFRGNVQTRLRKLDDGIAEATFLACAGLKRLGLDALIAAPIPETEMLPAVAQGAIALQIRTGDDRVGSLIAQLDHAETATCTAVERAFLARLDGSCRTPIAGLARLDGATVHFRGQILSPDGAHCHTIERSASRATAVAMADDTAGELLAQAGPGIFDGLT